MMQGFGVIWPELVSDLLAKREYGLEYTGLTDYYRLLDEYLDNQLELSPDSNEVDDYVEPEISEPKQEENEIPNSQEQTVDTYKEQETHENIIENTIDLGEDTQSKFGLETSTVAVMEIKNAPKENKEDNNEETKEAAYNTYWWIGIIVALAIVIVLIAVIARKRHNHKKQLERERTDNTRA